MCPWKTRGHGYQHRERVSEDRGRDGGDVATSQEIPGPLEQEEAERTLLAPPEGEQTHRTCFQTSASKVGRGRTPAVSGPHPHPAGGTLSRRPRDTDHREGQEGPPEDRRCSVAGTLVLPEPQRCSVRRLHRRETSPRGGGSKSSFIPDSVSGSSRGPHTQPLLSRCWSPTGRTGGQPPRPPQATDQTKHMAEPLTGGTPKSHGRGRSRWGGRRSREQT